MSGFTVRLIAVCAIVLALLLGAVPIIAGTLVCRRTEHKKLGTALRIFGYFILFPIAAVLICAAVLWLIPRIS